jgi:hypothetical protein
MNNGNGNIVMDSYVNSPLTEEDIGKKFKIQRGNETMELYLAAIVEEQGHRKYKFKKQVGNTEDKWIYLWESYFLEGPAKQALLSRMDGGRRRKKTKRNRKTKRSRRTRR